MAAEETFLDALQRAIEGGCAFNSREEVSPATLLWPDGAGEWASIVPRLRGRRPVLTLGTYAPDSWTGRGTWLRWAVEERAFAAEWPGIVPLVYLPGIVARSLEEAGAASEARDRAEDLALIAPLRHRGGVWTQPDGRDWTVKAFLERAAPGLGVAVRSDAATIAAMVRALPLLANVPVARLREEAPWRAADFEALAGHPAVSQEPDILALIAEGESATLEFKSSIRWDIRQQTVNKDLELMVLKSVAAFLNSGGGTLVIGVADDGSVLGLEQDQLLICKKPRDWDRLELHLMGIFRNHFGDALLPFVRVRFHAVGQLDVCRIAVSPAPEPAFVKDKGQEQFYVRAGNATSNLGIREAVRYIHHRWQ